MSSKSATLLALFLLGMPSVALARSAVVTPLLGKSGMDPLLVLSVTSLVSSEMELISGLEVRQLEEAPKDLNIACLTSSACLRGIASAHKAEVLVTGSISKVEEEFDLTLVYLDQPPSRKNVQRIKSWRLPTDSALMADRMTGIVSELLTGKKPAAKKDPAADVAALTKESRGDDIEFDQAKAGSGPASEDPPEDSLPEEESEEDLLLLAKAEKSARPKPAPEPVVEPEPETQPAPTPPKKSTKPPPEEDIQILPVTPGSMEDIEDDPDARSDLDDEEEEAREEEAREEEDPDRGRSEKKKKKNNKRDTNLDDPPRGRAKKGDSKDSKNPISIAARLGTGGYHATTFVTWGGELSVPISGGFGLHGGLEFLSSKQTVPEESPGCAASAVSADGTRSCWRSLMPLNLGARWQRTDPKTRPFVGVDLYFSPYHRDETGSLVLSDMATGVRLRGGSDFMLGERFGLGLNASLGYLSGENFQDVGLENSGLNWQISAGTIFSL